jgi:hypothetical protein
MLWIMVSLKIYTYPIMSAFIFEKYKCWQVLGFKQVQVEVIGQVLGSLNQGLRVYLRPKQAINLFSKLN